MFCAIINAGSLICYDLPRQFRFPPFDSICNLNFSHWSNCILTLYFSIVGSTVNVMLFISRNQHNFSISYMAKFYLYSSFGEDYSNLDTFIVFIFVIINIYSKSTLFLNNHYLNILTSFLYHFSIPTYQIKSRTVIAESASSRYLGGAALASLPGGLLTLFSLMFSRYFMSW